MSTNGAWVNGTFYDGIDLTAADLNANNQWLLAQANATILPNQANTWLARQTFNVGIVFAPVTFATLPGSPTDGLRAYITDSTVNTFGAAVTVGGGSDHVPLWYDGSVPGWKVG